MTCDATKIHCFTPENHPNTSNFLKEGEGPYDDGIWTRPRFVTAFSVYGPHFHVSVIRSIDLGIDTLVQ